MKKTEKKHKSKSHVFVFVFFLTSTICLCSFRVVCIEILEDCKSTYVNLWSGTNAELLTCLQEGFNLLNHLASHHSLENSAPVSWEPLSMAIKIHLCHIKMTMWPSVSFLHYHLLYQVLNSICFFSSNRITISKKHSLNARFQKYNFSKQTFQSCNSTLC